MFFLKKFKYIDLVYALFYFLILTISPVNAHILEETSAQVILRDGQVEIKLITDIDHFVAALQNNQAWLMGDIETVMPTSLSKKQQWAFVKKALKQRSHLTINKKEISFERIVLINNNSHDDEIIFQARHQFTDVNELSVSFHKVLGSIHINVVKPQYKLLNAGDSGRFLY